MPWVPAEAGCQCPETGERGCDVQQGGAKGQAEPRACVPGDASGADLHDDPASLPSPWVKVRAGQNPPSSMGVDG